MPFANFQLIGDWSRSQSAIANRQSAMRNGGPPRCRPVLCGLRDRCIAAMLATRRLIARDGVGSSMPTPDLPKNWCGNRELHPDELVGSQPCSCSTSLPRNGIPCWNRTSLCGVADRRLSCSANGIVIFRTRTFNSQPPTVLHHSRSRFDKRGADMHCLCVCSLSCPAFLQASAGNPMPRAKVRGRGERRWRTIVAVTFRTEPVS